MARLLTLGAEMGSSAEFTSMGTSVAGSNNWITGRVGGLALYNAGHSNSGSGGFWTKDIVGGGTEWYARLYCQAIAGGGAGNNHSTVRMIFYGTGAAQLQLEFGGGLPVKIYSNTTLLGTSTGVMQSGWNLIEIYHLSHSSTGIDVVKLNGVTEINFAGNNNPSAAGNLDYIRHDWASNSTYWDDIAINDTSGSIENGPPPAGGFIRMLLPNGNGSDSDWVGSDANSTDNYLLVDEGAPNSDTDYVESDTSGDEDFYDLTSYTLGAQESIVLLQPMIWAKRVALGTPLDIEIGINSGGTKDFTAAQALATAYALYYGDIYYTDPNTAASWGQSALNALQAGVKNG